MLRMILGRRWRRWLRLSILLLCLFVMWNLVRDLLPSGDRINYSEVNYPNVFDHWGKDDTDLNWMPNLLSKRTQEIPFVVVEEHYEVLKYWFQAADLGIIPASKNILIHIDAHSDGAVPFNIEALPVFRSPRSRQEIHNMMQRNDMFIVIAALTGLIDHVIWVWPDWDSANHDEIEKNHVTIEVEMGYMEIKILEEISRHRMDLCACWRVQDTDKNVEKGQEGLASWECHRRNFSEIEAEDGPEIHRLQCEIHARGVLEVISEAAAATELRKLKSSGQDLGIILDIDEDFYGCWSDMVKMQETGIKREDITLISDLVADLLFGLTAREEQLADEFYSSLLHLVINLKYQSCEIKGQQMSEKKSCLTNVAVSNYIIEHIPSILTFLQEDGRKYIIRPNDLKQSGFLLQNLLLFFQNFSIKQLKALADLGICFTVSPSSVYFQDDGMFHICHGDNMPNSTMVTFHLPTEQEITTRTVRLSHILNSLFQRPSLVTVSRSVRDGYTPKEFFSAIETNVLKSVASTFRGVQFENIHFDSNLLGGRFGWPHRSNNWSHKLLQYLSLKGISDL